MVKILLEQEGVNPDIQNHTDQTSLSYAAQYGYEKVVKMLLEQEGVNPNRPDNHGQRPLMYAAKHGHQEVIELLQPYGAVTHGVPLAIGDTEHYI